MPQLILSLDCGSTHFKAALFNESLHRIAEALVTTPYTVFTNREVELDADEVWAAAVELFNAVCRNGNVSISNVTHVTITSQAQTFGVFRQDGKALTPFYSWIDKRAEAEAGVLESELGNSFHHHCSFPHPVAQLHGAKLLWLRNNQPHMLPPDSLILPLPSYITWKLAGIPVVDENLAAMSGLYSFQQQGWWREALEICKVSPNHLPKIVSVGTAVTARRCSDAVPLREDLKVVLAGNDQTSGAIGNNCTAGTIILTLGTALVLYRYAGEAVGPYSRGGIWGPYPGGGYYELATRDEGCMALDWAREQLMPQQDTATFIQEAEAGYNEQRQSRVQFLPQRIRTDAAWEIPDGSTPSIGERALAVLEGINESVRELLEDDLGVPVSGLSSVTVIGGGSQSKFWRDLLSQTLGCPVEKGDGDSLLGAAKMAIIGYE